MIAIPSLDFRLLDEAGRIAARLTWKRANEADRNFAQRLEAKRARRLKAEFNGTFKT